ncbi:isoprenylcysteine carboxyl methyltransferase family protein [Streptomyces soliscabiei]|uniref:isoprenylcysteine carboxyl methyltransferase family protein n=1 Tax=Streptomyces soliscabiei TaxID=588897 RepID=UPI0029C04503|nr:isoprenylcysteine carboxylmethyltransferase family protein [Streptomyces sp. NY05-11A]
MTLPGTAAVPLGALVLVSAMCCVRLVELCVARRNTRWATAHGGVEYGRRSYPVVIVLHTCLVLGIPLEVALAHRPFVPVLGWSAVAVLVLVQTVRGWCMHALGPRWNTRIVVVPGLPLVHHGPYRYLRHPNYIAVVLEGAALPMVHTAWLTAVLFTSGNTVFLAFWARMEDRALRLHTQADPASFSASPSASTSARCLPRTPASCSSWVRQE